MLFYVREHTKAKPAVVLVLKQGHGLKYHPTVCRHVCSLDRPPVRLSALCGITVRQSTHLGVIAWVFSLHVFWKNMSQCTGVCSYVQNHVIGALGGFSQFLANVDIHSIGYMYFIFPKCVLLFYVLEHPKAKPTVVLVLKRLRRRGHGLKYHPTVCGHFCSPVRPPVRLSVCVMRQNFSPKYAFRSHRMGFQFTCILKNIGQWKLS